MITVTVSPKYEIVIPEVVREALAIKPGQKFQVIHTLNRFELVPISQMKPARGFLKGLNSSIEREDDRL
jgi:AbrB family looped-hinge helix DNA binding protein